jgi:hypothetical protein
VSEPEAEPVSVSELEMEPEAVFVSGLEAAFVVPSNSPTSAEPIAE